MNATNFHPSRICAALVLAVVVPSAKAEVPQLLNYQGRVRVSGSDFSGTGQFKFSLVSGSGAVTYWSNDGTGSGGGQPVAAVSLPVQAGLYTVLLGDATLPNMTVLTPGVFSNNDVRLRVWFSDGVNGWQQLTPDQRVAAVGYALMANDVKDGAVTASKLAAGAVTASKLAPGSVTAAALDPGAVLGSLNAAGQGAVPSGASLLSSVPDAPALLAAGYQSVGTLNASDSWTSIAGGTARDTAASVWTGTEMLIWGDGTEGWRYNPKTNVWRVMSVTNQPANRDEPMAVWTGTEMIVWGGISGGVHVNTGGRYNPVTDTWVATSTTNAPSARAYGSAVWTGSEMIIFGGVSGSTPLADGGRFNPASGANGSWTTLTATNAPSFRYFHTAVWSGSEMIVYGGRNGAAALNDGARFNPAAAGSWTALPAGPSARYYHTALWTGNGMIVWGGTDTGVATPFKTGSIYRPPTNDWVSVGTAGAPDGRLQHGAVWTGSEMIVFGGTTSSTTFAYSSVGARYNVLNNSWTLTTQNGAPAARVRPNMVWSGNQLTVWGGSNGSPLAEGGNYRLGQTFYLYQRP